MNSNPSDDVPLSPDEPVWNHMESGLQMARDDLSRQLGTNDVSFFTALAAQVLALRVGVVISETDTEVPRFLADGLPTISPELWRKVIRQLPQSPEGWSPFLRHAVEIGIAERSLSRMYAALDRYSQLQPLLVTRAIPERVRPYLRELSDVYLFGFDAACIALACACFEQVGKGALVATGKMTERQIEKDKLTSEGVLMRLKEHDLVSASAAAALRLTERRNRILHRSLYEASVLPVLALDSIREFLEVCEELAPSWPPAT